MVRAGDDAMRPELPDDVGAVHALLLRFRRERDEAVAQRDALVAERAALAQERDALTAQNDRLRHLLAKLRRAQFGRKSERLPEEQLQLAFEEIEASIAANEAEAEKRSPKLREERAVKRREGRGRLPLHLPRIELVLEPEDTACPCCRAEMTVIGHDTSERLDVIPAQFRVLVTRRPKLACRACEGVVVQAPAPERLIPGGMPTPWFGDQGAEPCPNGGSNSRANSSRSTSSSPRPATWPTNGGSRTSRRRALGRAPPAQPGGGARRVVGRPAAPAPMLADRTPQASVTRARRKPSECDIVVVVLWRRLGTPLPDEHRKADGGTYGSGTEWEYEDALRATPRPDILVYRRAERVLLDADDPEVTAKLAQREQVKRFFARFCNPDGSLGGGVTKYGTPSAFAERLKTDLRELIATMLEGPFRPPAEDTELLPGAAAAELWSGSPYPRPAFLHGRGGGDLLRPRARGGRLVARLRDPAQRFLAVVGASGTASRRWSAPACCRGSRTAPSRAASTGPYSPSRRAPWATTRSWHLRPSWRTCCRRTPRSRRSGSRRRSPRRRSGLLDYADTLLAERPAGAALVLFVDQLEELFTAAAERHRGAFAGLLALAAGDPRLRVLATLRADFLPQGMAFLPQGAAEPVLAPLLQAGNYLLGPPGPIALLEMIRRPAERAGLTLEEGFADAILQDAGGEPGEALPLVAFCLEELYRRTAPEHRLTLAAYRAMGRLRGAIGRRTGKLLEELGKAEGADLDAALPQLFRALVHVDAAGKAARRRASRDVLRARARPSPVPSRDADRRAPATGGGGRWPSHRHAGPRGAAPGVARPP
jgi:hypothetical protein